MQKTGKIILGSGCVLVLLLAIGGAVWFSAELDRTLPRDPPTEALPMLVRNLPTQTVEIEPAFQRRVRAQFHDGMPDAALAQNLRRKGFHIREDHKNSLRIASLEQHGLPCVLDWVIYWSPDAEGRAQKIGAHFNAGCL
jgi:hypothetical protein